MSRPPGVRLGANGDGNRFEQTGGDEAFGASVEVEEGVGGAATVDAVLVAESDDGVGGRARRCGGSIRLVTAVSASQPQSGRRARSITARRAQEIALEQIDVGGNVRELDAEHVSALAGSMKL